MLNCTVGDLYDRCVKYYRKHTAITYKDEEYSYDEMGKKANRLTAAFQNLGMQKSDKVAFLMPNCPEYVFCEYAVAKIGCVRIPLAVLLSGKDHVYMMNLTECKMFIYHQEMVDRVQAMLPDLQTVEHFVCVGDDNESMPEGHHNLKEFLTNDLPEPTPAVVFPEDLLAICFTGGTTGKPKGVMLSHRSWVYTVLTQSLEFDIGREEVFAYTTPMTHAAGGLLLPVLLKKGRCVILGHFDAKAFLSAVQREEITATFMVPTMIYVLLDFPESGSYDVSSLRNILYGGSAIAPERLKQAISVFGPVFTQLFGQTEAPMAISSLPREEHIVKDPRREKMILSSAGRPTFQTELKIVGENGREVPTGESGEVVVRCANVMNGYYENPQATAETLKDGWLYTGDIARQDEEGFIYIVDRKKDMIVSGGFNIFPREIEDVLFEHPAVRRAAVIGVPHEKWGEAVKAIVVLTEGAAVREEELIAFVKERKGSLVAPKSIEFCDEIPLTNLGKIDKKKIRAEFWKGRDRLVC